MQANRIRIAFLCLLAAGLMFPVQGCSPAAARPQAQAGGAAEEMRSGTLQAVVKTAKPLAKDGVPGKFSKNFQALQKAFGLAAVPTYDGSNQSTHPKALYFPDGWNGYRCWMSVTPYPRGVDKFENPCIVASNDLKTWVVPKGLNNPVTGVPRDLKYGGHYSDSHLVMRGNIMELWYRVNKGSSKTKRADYTMDYYYRMTSADGVHWTEPELMHEEPTSILSLVVNYENGEYEFWYTDKTNQLYHAESKDGTTWDHTQMCSIPLQKNYTPWHQDLIHYKGLYYLLQSAKNLKKYGFLEFLSESSDGIHFTKGVPFYPSDNPVILNKSWLYRSTLFADENNTFQMMISVRLPGQQWYLMKCSISVPDWQKACQTQKPMILKDPGSGGAAVKPAGPKQKQSAAPKKPVLPSIGRKQAKAGVQKARAL